MDKIQLAEILNNPFSQKDWQKVVIEIFGARRLYSTPKSIRLNATNNKAEEAYELGSFNTSDDRIIGLYHIKLNEKVWLERNKVGLRELLRSVYKYEVDGALIVFEQQGKWRLSFVSEIRTFDEQGHIAKKATEPKRYTYLLGKGEKVKTPVIRLMSLAGKVINLEDIRSAFSVEALNEDFYKIVARHFYQLVGATEGNGAKAVSYSKILQLPNITSNLRESNKIYQEFSVRLIGRTVFCWFLKVKKSRNGISLLPEHLLSSEAVVKNSNYYHVILEKLFFQTLNTPMDNRIDTLPAGCEQIPFLNGGLFEPQFEDYYKPDGRTGLSENINSLKIPDAWFKDLFENLEQFNFTLDENSVVDVEVSVDPEILGRIFENLLAEIDPDSGDSARKATGSFYTPREIVDYMASQTLECYLYNQTDIDKKSLHPIFKLDSEVSFSKDETEKILEALDQLKILDPACGSGAFPMGMLQKIVMALQKLDPEAEWWKSKQIQKIENPILRKQLKQKLDQTTVEYARKIGIIQNSLYGVDIQPIAAEISKLRCFLTLVVDENIDETKPNRGIEPLPNLEFKFVTADTLIKLPEQSGVSQLGKSKQKNTVELERELHEVRQEYLQCFGAEKGILKQRFLEIQKLIFDQQGLFGAVSDSRSHLISTWNPFSHDKVDWFDSLWMYGVKQFDIVIGNPPYGITYSKEQIESFRRTFTVVVGHSEAYYLFSEIGFSLLKSKGILAYIAPNAWLSNKYAKGLRSLILKEKSILTLINLNQKNIFKSAGVENSIFIVSNEKAQLNSVKVGSDIDEQKIFNFEYSSWLASDSLLINFSENPLIENILASIKIRGVKFSTILDISNGFKPYQVGYGKNLSGQPLTKSDVEDKIYHSDNKIDSCYQKQVKGKNVNKYIVNWTQGYVKWGPWLMSPKDEKYYVNPKILVRQIISDTLIAAYDNEQFYADQTLYVLINYPGRFQSLKFYTAILNSKLMGFYFRKFYSEEDDLFPKIKVNELKDLPVPSGDKINVNIFEVLVDYIILIKKIENHHPINEYVPNSHIAQTFEEVLDVLIYELYFPEEFKSAQITLMKYAERDFESIVGKDEKDAIEIIHASYQKMRAKENEIRQNIKLMDTRLYELIMPIKTAK